MPKSKVKKVKAWAVINKQGQMFAPESDHNQISVFSKVNNLPKVIDNLEVDIVPCTITYEIPAKSKRK